MRKLLLISSTIVALVGFTAAGTMPVRGTIVNENALYW